MFSIIKVGVADFAEVKYPNVSSVGGDFTAPIFVRKDGFNATIPIAENAISIPKFSDTESDIITALKSMAPSKTQAFAAILLPPDVVAAAQALASAVAVAQSLFVPPFATVHVLGYAATLTSCALLKCKSIVVK